MLLRLPERADAPPPDLGLWQRLAGRAAPVIQAGHDAAERRVALRRSGGPLDFIETLIEAGVPADVNRPLTFEGREFWRDIYETMDKPRFCVKSSAQVGKTIMLFYGLAALAHLLYFRGVGIWHGLYLPTQEMVRAFSKGRLAPILNAIGQVSGVRCGSTAEGADTDKLLRDLLPLVEEDQRDDFIDSFNFKRIGNSYVYMAWMKGMLRDALPLDVLWFDEVRLMDPSQVDRVRKRVSGSKYGWIGYTSTAGLPGDAIDAVWEQSDQRHFHNFCRCSDGVELNKEWPHCVRERRNPASPHERFYLVCPRCDTEIDDPGYGRWIAHKPETGLFPGFNPHQLITQRPLWQIMEEWTRTGRNTGEFYNSTLGLEYIDDEACPITLPVLRSCVNTDLMWARPGDVRRCAMGIDQMGGVCYFDLSEKTKDGSRRIVHLEIRWDLDPFKRAAELMREYDVSVCCVEGLPNYNDALRFANEFPGRVFVVSYGDVKDADLQWGDRQKDPEAKRKVSQEARTRFTVRIDYTKMLDALASNWRDRRAELPDPAGIFQEVQDEHGKPFVCALGEEVFFDHLRRIARRKQVETKIASNMEIAEETGIERHYWVKLAKAPGEAGRPVSIRGAASDPHFAFADALNWVAWTRLPARKSGAVRAFVADGFDD